MELAEGAGTDGIQWNMNDPSTLAYLRKQLPSNLQEHLLSTSGSSDDLKRALSTIVAPAARHQSFKGIFTLGPRRSFQYASAKLSKGLFSNKRMT
jgi:hypothetical protein